MTAIAGPTERSSQSWVACRRLLVHHKDTKSQREDRGRLVDESPDAVLQRRDVEVDEQPQPEVLQSQVGQELGVMDRPQLLDRLQLDDHEAADEEVDPV